MRSPLMRLCRRRRHRHIRAFSLAGMLVSLSLGLIASLVAFVTFRIASVAYRDIVDHIMMEERGHRALAVLAHAIRHAGHVSPVVASTTLPAGDSATAAALSEAFAPIVGHDDCGAMFTDTDCARAGFQRSDALRVRMSGSSHPDDPTLPDGTMSDCGGFALPARAEGSLSGDAYSAHGGERYARNVFYIGRAADGVPQLMCRYPARRDGRMAGARSTRGALIRGVETMQFRYGVDRDDDGMIDEFLRADDLHAHGTSGWHAVRAVRIALVMRGERRERRAGTRSLVLFGEADHATPDDHFVPTHDLDRRRHVFTTTVRLRNPSSCREASC